jgi:hypothetical protein
VISSSVVGTEVVVDTAVVVLAFAAIAAVGSTVVVVVLAFAAIAAVGIAGMSLVVVALFNPLTTFHNTL